MTKRHLIPHTDGRKQSRNSFISTSSQRHLRPSRFYLPRSSQKSTWAAETTRPRPRTVTHEALVGDSLSTPSRPKPSPIPRTKITLIIATTNARLIDALIPVVSQTIKQKAVVEGGAHAHLRVNGVFVTTSSAILDVAAWTEISTTLSLSTTFRTSHIWNHNVTNNDMISNNLHIQKTL